MPRKKFIDKKNAVTFHLVHRSQKDPLQADEDAPKRVLLPAAQDSDTRKEELLKFGVLFDDDYDYLQHLRETSEIQSVEPTETYRLVAKKSNVKPKSEGQIQLPSTVFGTDFETEVGLLNKAAPLSGPQLDWDPDIVEALDDDFDFDNPSNQLEDDFFLKANAEYVCEDTIDETSGSSMAKPGRLNDDDFASDEADFSGEDDDDVRSLGEQSFMSAETKTRFTNYSMSSSIMKRNKGLTMLDDKFERLFEQYDDSEVGALDHEEITGFIQDDDRLLNDALEQWQEISNDTNLKDTVLKSVTRNFDIVSGSESSDTEIVEVTEVDKDDKWDCESFLSTYSNIYNHPKKIVETSSKVKPIKLTKRIGIPDDVLPTKGMTLKQLEKEERQQRQQILTAPTDRPKNESADEKKARKQAVKDQRRERRVEKKMNTRAFKDEELRLHKEVINLNTNLRGTKIL